MFLFWKDKAERLEIESKKHCSLQFLCRGQKHQV